MTDFDSSYFRNVMLNCNVISKKILKTRESKNVIVETVEHTINKAIQLSCGHKVNLSSLSKAPKNKMKCSQCYWLDIKKELTE
jgi:hypothetical protein